MINQKDFEQIQEEVLDHAYILMFEDIHLTLNEAYIMAVEEIAQKRSIPLRVFNDPVSGDLYIAIGEGDPVE